MKLAQEGFATVAFVVLLPVIVAAIATLQATFTIIKQDGATRHACRVDLLDAQTQVADDLEALLALNPEALDLRIQLDQAEQEVEASAATPAVALALAHLAAVQAAQVALHAEQQALIQLARFTSRSAPSLTVEHVRQSLEKEHRLQASRTSVGSSFDSHVTRAQFDVIGEPETSVTPSYRVSQNFRARQEMRAEWSVDVGALLPEWLKKIIPASGFRMKAECSTTLTEKDSAWHPQITMGKRSLSFSSLRSFL